MNSVLDVYIHCCLNQYRCDRFQNYRHCVRTSTYQPGETHVTRLEMERAIQCSLEYVMCHMLTNLTVGRPHFTLWSNVSSECLLFCDKTRIVRFPKILFAKFTEFNEF